MKRNDLIVAVIVLFIAGGLFLWQKTAFDASNGTVAVYLEKEKIGEFPLKENKTLELQGADGGVNQLIIEDGEAWIAQADCPDGLCIRQGRISRTGQSIVCLPHKLVITVEGGELPETDGVLR